MDLKKSKSFLLDLENSLKDVRWEISALTNENKRLNNQLKELNDIKKNNRENLARIKYLNNFYLSVKRNYNIDTCPECDGEGGHSWEESDGSANGEECSLCIGSGIVKGNIDMYNQLKPKDINENTL